MKRRVWFSSNTTLAAFNQRTQRETVRGWTEGGGEASWAERGRECKGVMRSEEVKEEHKGRKRRRRGRVERVVLLRASHCFSQFDNNCYTICTLDSPSYCSFVISLCPPSLHLAILILSILCLLLLFELSSALFSRMLLKSTRASVF